MTFDQALELTRERLMETMGFIPCDQGAHVTSMLLRGELYIVLPETLYYQLYPLGFCNQQTCQFLNHAAAQRIRAWIRLNVPAHP